MGTILTSNFKGKCKECGTEYGSGDAIFYDKVKGIACVDRHCAVKRGWSETRAGKPINQSTFPSRQKSSFKEEVDLTFVIPKEAPVVADERFLEFLNRANTLAEKMYPNLDRKSNTFGQIRSKILDQLIALS